VGLHPVGNSDPFSQGKSFGKLNSYILRGVPIVVQRMLDYPDFFRDGENGMLANEPEEWVEKIYQLLVTPTLRDKVAAQVKRDFQRELSSKAYAQKVHSLLETLL
jgi:glycosyltransferase involved in cell wall biosynthesis